MNQILNDEIRDDPMRSKIPGSKNFLKANDILSKATTSYNFYKHKNKKDIMEKITNILNDKGNKENFDSCYLIGNPNDNAKNSNYKYNSDSNTNNIFNHNNIYNNKNNFLKTVIASENKFLKPKQDLNFNNINNYNPNNNVNNKKYALEDNFNTKREIPRYLKNEGIKAFSPKADYNNKFNLNFFDNLNIYRDTNLIRMNMPYATSQFLDKNENKIFTDKVKNEINSNDINKYPKNNFKAFYEQFNNSKSKHNKNSTLRESIENKPDSYPDRNKNEEQDKSLKYFKCKDPESTNLFLTKFNMKNKQKDNFEINSGQINKNLNNSNSLNLNKNNPLQNENNLKDKPHISPNKGVSNNKEILPEKRNKEIEQNVSKSIDIEKEADSSYHSLKNEFSFLLEKKCESETFNLRDIINDVRIAQNKLSSEYDDIKNLLKYANDTKSKLQMHKTDNRFSNVKNKLNSINNNNFNHKAYTDHVNNMIINNTNGYLKNSANMNNKNFNSNKKDREKDKEAIEEKKNNLNKQEPIKVRGKIDYKIKLNKADNLPNTNSLSADEYFLLGENSKISKKRKKQRSRAL